MRKRLPNIHEAFGRAKHGPKRGPLERSIEDFAVRAKVVAASAPLAVPAAAERIKAEYLSLVREVDTRPELKNSGVGFRIERMGPVVAKILTAAKNTSAAMGVARNPTSEGELP